MTMADFSQEWLEETLLEPQAGSQPPSPDAISHSPEFAEPDCYPPLEIDVTASGQAALTLPQSDIADLEFKELNLKELQPFEVVEDQFQKLGVQFSNAIALVPSNPAYPSANAQLVLMGSPKRGWLEATFATPVKFVTGYVTSSRRTVMAAFDETDTPVAQIETGANLAGSGSTIPPNVPLSLRGKNIRRVTFYTFDGQLTLGRFRFGM